MGANNCKSQADVDALLDNVFRMLYTQLVMFTLEIMLPGLIPFLNIGDIENFLELMVY